jgi:hypothetical protein
MVPAAAGVFDSLMLRAPGDAPHVKLLLCSSPAMKLTACNMCIAQLDHGMVYVSCFLLLAAAAAAAAVS